MRNGVRPAAAGSWSPGHRGNGDSEKYKGPERRVQAKEGEVHIAPEDVLQYECGAGRRERNRGGRAAIDQDEESRERRRGEA